MLTREKIVKKSPNKNIAGRKKEISRKTYFIVTNLGRCSRVDGGNIEETCVFRDERFRIVDYILDTADWSAFHREIKYNGKVVFYISSGDRQESFVPGEWEKEFHQLYAQAQFNATQKREARKRFGL